MMDPTSLYVHIPFCASKCFYCDFNSYVSTSDVMDRFTYALDREFQFLADACPIGTLKTVFFGGGTPTLLSATQLERVLTSLHRHFRIEAGAEVTMEANPGTVDLEKLRVLHDHGVSRLSFGAQTFDDTLLQAIGRLHDADAIVRGMDLARQVGFSSVNLDLMFGLPGQTIATLDSSLAAAVRLTPDHLSVYGLKIEQGTPFAVWYDRGVIELPAEDEEVGMYEHVIARTHEAGYRQYEISNFALPGKECKHNLVYWHNEPYLAAGPGAHGYVAGLRYMNQRAVPTYMATVESGARPVDDETPVTEPEAREDTMMLGLRLLDGVDPTAFRKKHGVDVHSIFSQPIERNVRLGLLEYAGERIRLTGKGLFLANEVFADFLGNET